MGQSQKVIILGASDKADRYAYKAFKMLQEHGHEVYLIHPKLKDIDGQKVFSQLGELPDDVYDTLTMYLRPEISSTLIAAILKLSPKRVILNPGTENDLLEQALQKNGIKSERACTLVLLSTQQFN